MKLNTQAEKERNAAELEDLSAMLNESLTRLDCQVGDLPQGIWKLRRETENEISKSRMSLRHRTVEIKKSGIHQRDVVDKKSRSAAVFACSRR